MRHDFSYKSRERVGFQKSKTDIISSSVFYKFLILEIIIYQVVFMKTHLKIASFESLCYIDKAFELFSKINFESSWAFESMKICKIMYFMTSLVSGIDFFDIYLLKGRQHRFWSESENLGHPWGNHNLQSRLPKVGRI